MQEPKQSITRNREFHPWNVHRVPKAAGAKAAAELAETRRAAMTFMVEILQCIRNYDGRCCLPALEVEEKGSTITQHSEYPRPSFIRLTLTSSLVANYSRFLLELA